MALAFCKTGTANRSVSKLPSITTITHNGIDPFCTCAWTLNCSTSACSVFTWPTCIRKVV